MAGTLDFMRWVTDPRRTNDDLFTVEIILESLRLRPDWPFKPASFDWEVDFERKRERKQNPAYRPALRRDHLEALAASAGTVHHFHTIGGQGDRPVRELEALRFFPAIKSIALSGSDVSDLSPLAALEGVERLSIGEYADLYRCRPLCMAQCGAMPALQFLHLALRHPWPDLRALAGWPALREINYNGNILAWEDVEALPAARVVLLQDWVSGNVPVRDLRRLPQMPVVEILAIGAAASLEGIERYPTALNLEARGIFADLGPLTRLEKITAVTLAAEGFQDLRPLTELPRLREIKFIREWPLDLAPLSDCPQLRRVEYERCAMMRTELAALNAGLLPEAADFEAPVPRPLAPLKFYSLPKDDQTASAAFRARKEAIDKEKAEFFAGDLVLAKAADRVYGAQLQARLDELLGRGWGLCEDAPAMVNLRRYPDTILVREVIQLLREQSARWRWPVWHMLHVEPHGDMTDDLETIAARDAKATQPDEDWLAAALDPEKDLEDTAEFRRQREERYELLQREHLQRLRGEEAVDPELLDALKAEAEIEEEADGEPVTPTEDEDDSAGGVAIAPPPPAPPETRSLGEALAYYLDVYEDCVVVNSHWADAAAYGLGEKPVEWRPEPPRQSPATAQ